MRMQGGPEGLGKDRPDAQAKKLGPEQSVCAERRVLSEAV